MILWLNWQIYYYIGVMETKLKHDASDTQSLFFNSCEVETYANCSCRTLDYSYYMLFKKNQQWSNSNIVQNSNRKNR